MLEKLKAERAAQVATPVPGQAGVTPVPEGVTVTKVPPGASGVAEKPVVAKVKTPKVKTPIPLPGKSPLAPKPVDKWELIATDLRDQGIPEHQIADLIERGKSGQLESAPLEEVVAEVEAKSAARAAAKAPKVKVDPVRAATLKAEAKQAATIPKLEGVPEKMPSNERPLAYAKDETIEARAKQGDALAVRELGWRKQEAGSSFMDAMSATVEGAKGKIKKVVGEETGAVGPGTGKLIRQQEAAKSYRELASKDPSDPFNPNWAADRENAARARVAAEIEQNTNNPRQVAPEDFPGQHDFVRDVQDRRNRQNFDRQKEVDPEKFAYERQTAKANYPNMTNEEIDQHLFNRFAERADEVARSAAEESQGRNFPRGQETDDWGKYRPKWENPPFRGVQQLPEVTGEQIDALKADRRIPPYAGDTTERMVPNENWYAGQHGIDRAQVERMKKYGVNDPGDSADMPPSVVIDENSNYQITDGHHRSTASLETGEPVDYNVTDRSPIGWFRKNRTLRGEDSPFIQAGRAEAERGISSMDEQGASSGGGESDPALQRPSAWERLLGEETGAAGPGTGAIAREQRRNQGPPLTGAKKMAQGAFDAVNQARMTSMLSGLALPKSLLGNLGSHFTAAAETKSLAPLKALGDYKAIGSDLATGWKASENPALGGGLSRFNVPGRIMGAADHAATQSLMRSGLSEAHAKEILLTSPNPVSGWKPLNTNLGKLVVPFKTTPFNQFGEGLTRYAKHPGLYVGAAGLGAGAGMLTKDPDKLGLAMGAMGPYAVPFTVGAMTTAGARAAQGISPIPEWSIQKTLSEPQAAFTESPGLRWFEPGFGFGKDVPKDKTGSRPSAPSRPTGRPTRK
jgi:hypothetical protein